MSTRLWTFHYEKDYYVWEAEIIVVHDISASYKMYQWIFSSGCTSDFYSLLLKHQYLNEKFDEMKLEPCYIQ